MQNKQSQIQEDPELLEKLCAIRNGDADAFAWLRTKYAPLLRQTANSFAPSLGITSASPVNALGLEMEGLLQEAEMVLYRAALRYDENGVSHGKHVSFGLYAKICIRNAFISETRRYGRYLRSQKKWMQEDAQKAAARFADSMSVDSMLSEEGMQRIQKILSPYENQILPLYIIGKPPREIAAELNRSEKSVSNAMYRMKVKIRGLLEQN